MLNITHNPKKQKTKRKKNMGRIRCPYCETVHNVTIENPMALQDYFWNILLGIGIGAGIIYLIKGVPILANLP